MVGNFTVLAINLKLLSRRLPVDKGRTFTHATLIVAHFNSDTQRLLRFFEEWEIKERKLCNKNVPIRVKGFLGTNEGISPAELGVDE